MECDHRRGHLLRAARERLIAWESSVRSNRPGSALGAELTGLDRTGPAGAIWPPRGQPEVSLGGRRMSPPPPPRTGSGGATWPPEAEAPPAGRNCPRARQRATRTERGPAEWIRLEISHGHLVRVRRESAAK